MRAKSFHMNESSVIMTGHWVSKRVSFFRRNKKFELLRHIFRTTSKHKLNTNTTIECWKHKVAKQEWIICRSKFTTFDLVVFVSSQSSSLARNIMCLVCVRIHIFLFYFSESFFLAINFSFVLLRAVRMKSIDIIICFFFYPFTHWCWL